MVFYSIEQKIMGIGKETTRGVAVSPSRFIPITADSFIDYRLNLIEDELVRGIFERFPPQAGTKEATGTIGIEVESGNIGEFLLGLLGSVNTQDVGSGGGAYKHIFKRASGISLPTFTLHFDLGMVKKRYPLTGIKSIAFTGAGDGKLSASISVISKTEETTNETYIPNWQDFKPFMFYQTQIKLDGVAVSFVKDWNLSIDNGSVGIRTLNGSQDITDILAFAKMVYSGGMTIYFENENERNKFLNNTSVNIEIILTGEEIESGYNHQLKFIIPKAHYTAYPFGNVDGLLGAAVGFNGYFSIGSQYGIQVELINNITSY